MTNLTASALALLQAQRDAETHTELTIEAVRRGRIRTIALCRTYGLTWAQIGEGLGVSANTARMKYERGA